MYMSLRDYVVGCQLEIIVYLLEFPDFRLIHTSQLQSNDPSITKFFCHYNKMA